MHTEISLHQSVFICQVVRCLSPSALLTITSGLCCGYLLKTTFCVFIPVNFQKLFRLLFKWETESDSLVILANLASLYVLGQIRCANRIRLNKSSCKPIDPFDHRPKVKLGLNLFWFGSGLGFSFDAWMKFVQNLRSKLQVPNLTWLSILLKYA